MSNTTALSTRVLYSVGIGVGITMLSGAVYWYHKYWKRDVVPTKWRRVGTLAQLNIFPIKSCAPLMLDPEVEVACEVLGCRVFGVRDRCLMLVDKDYKMITARIYPKMVLIETKIIGTHSLLISAPHMEDLELNFNTLKDEAPGTDVHTTVWGDDVDAMLCGEKYDKWFSKCILNKDSGLHLVYYPYPQPVRPIRNRQLKEPFITLADTGTFGDATSYMLMNLASVNDLNTRLKNPVDPLQFRGNFHLKMDHDEPCAEDNWKWMKIGDNTVFRVVAPCTRCIFPNINVVTGERDPDGEPLKTLNKYRKWPKYASPVLGIHMGVRQEGVIKLNDVISVEDS